MSSVRLAALAALLGCASLWGAVADAQVYRIVGPDGRVTFSDRPPPDAKATPAASLPLPASTGPASGSPLPAELRGAASRYPFTLYTGRECAPCDAARAFLSTRGVPFTEKTVTTEPDARAVRNLSGVSTLPFATLGGQHLIGFSESEWSQYLDAAGYPKTSQIPPGYRNPAPSPVVAVESPRVAPPGAAGRAAAPAPAPQVSQPEPLSSEPSPSNPAGIRF
jgi:glutaredoxin